MMEQGKISTIQLCMMIFLMVGSTSILVAPAITASTAGRDMWISPIWGSLSGFLSANIALRLHKLYPNKTVIQLCEIILGRYAGRSIGLAYLFFLLQNIGFILREYGEFLHTAFLLKTPIMVIMGSLVLTCSFAVRSGVEVLARCTQLFFPFLFAVFMIILLLLIPDFKPLNMFPVMEGGWGPSLKGSIQPHAWFIEYFLITFFLPFVVNLNAKQIGLFSVLMLAFIMITANLVCLFMFGDVLTSKLTFPTFNAARYISLADFLEHLESLTMAFWIIGGFIQISLWYYALVIGTAQWLHINRYRHLTIPIGVFMWLNGYWAAPNFQIMIDYFENIVPSFQFTFLLIIPLILLGIARLRTRTHI